MPSLISKCYRIALQTIVLVAAVSSTLNAKVGRAEGLADQVHSLESIPADAAFYSASLRLKEQCDSFLGSKAYAKLMEIPIVQLAKMQVMFQWQASPEPVVATVRNYFASSEGQETVAVVKEMFTDEMFCYGGSDFTEVVPLLMKLNTVQRRAQMEAVTGSENEMEIMGRLLLEIFEENAESFQIPDLVFGFRIQNRERATGHLAHVETKLRELLEEQRPELVERLKRETVAGHEFLTMRLDGTLLPWDEVRRGVEDINEEQFEKWKKLLSSKTLVVALGVVDEFVLLSTADSTDHIATFGQGDKLAAHASIAKLAAHADKRVTSIGYASEELLQSANSSEQQIEDFVAGLEQGLQMGEISEEKRKALVEDIRAAAAEMMESMPEPGAASAIEYRTDRGYEGFYYNWGSMPALDSSKSLSVLSHVGGNPLAFFATHAEQTVEDYDQMVSWFKRIGGHVEGIVQEKARPEDWAKYQEVRGKGVALLERMDRANREFLIPALADGQDALVVDVQAESKQWIAQMPESPKPLPMLEVGIACSVKDADLLSKGVKEYFAVVDDAMSLLHELNPADVPAAKLPEAETREIAGGTMHVYSLPPEWQVDEAIAINGGITTTTAAVTTAPLFTERLLVDTELKLDTAIDMKRPAARVVHFDFAKLINALQPWIDYGVAVGTGQLKSEDAADSEEPEDPSPAVVQAGFILPQVHQLLDVLESIDCYSSVTYHDGDAWVTHGETHLKDLK